MRSFRIYFMISCSWIIKKKSPTTKSSILYSGSYQVAKTTIFTRKSVRRSLIHVFFILFQRLDLRIIEFWILKSSLRIPEVISQGKITENHLVPSKLALEKKLIPYFLSLYNVLSHCVHTLYFCLEIFLMLFKFQNYFFSKKKKITKCAFPSL